MDSIEVHLISGSSFLPKLKGFKQTKDLSDYTLELLKIVPNICLLLLLFLFITDLIYNQPEKIISMARKIN